MEVRTEFRPDLVVTSSDGTEMKLVVAESVRVWVCGDFALQYPVKPAE
jgi:hypothetical protein